MEAVSQKDIDMLEKYTGEQLNSFQGLEILATKKYYTPSSLPNTNQRNTSLPSNQFPCIACKEEVTWERDAMCCDACDGWMHRDCAGIDTLSFSRLQHSNCMWICPVCNNPNFSYVLFNSPITTSTDNSILAALTLSV